MNKLPKFASVRLAVALAAALAVTTASSHAQSATATISDTPGAGGTFDYTITLKNTSGGSINLNSFWYGWTAQLGNTLPSNPTSPANSLGWDNVLDANSIMWKNTTGTALAPNAVGTFTFVSTSDPTAIETAPSGDSVAYVGGIDFSQGAAGDSTSVFAPNPTVTPEPATWVMLTAGLLLMAGSFKSLPRVCKLRQTV